MNRYIKHYIYEKLKRGIIIYLVPKDINKKQLSLILISKSRYFYYTIFYLIIFY